MIGSGSRPAVGVALVVCLVVASAPGLALSGPRDRPQDTSPPVVVYVDETLDISAVEETDGGTIGTGPVTLVGIGGDADGHAERIDDSTDADFEYFETGTYDTDGDGSAEFFVEEPRVTELVLRDERGVNVTGDTVADVESVTVRARFNFDDADGLDVVVTDPSGVEIQGEIADSTRITESDGTVTLDMSGERDGTYRITAEGSDLSRATRTVTLTVGTRTPRTGTETPRQTPTATATATATPGPTVTPSATPSTTVPPTETATPTTAPPQTATPSTPTPSATDVSTEGDGPGYGMTGTAVALLLSVALGMARREE